MDAATGDTVPGPALVVDDDPVMQQRLARLLAQPTATGARIRCAGSIAEAKSRVQAETPCVALVDIGLPDGNGIELIAWLHAEYPDTQSVVVSTFGDEDTVVAALHAGATGYLLKERDDLELGMALQSMRRGGAPIDPFVARRILSLLAAPSAESTPGSAPGEPKSSVTLTERETEILNLVSRGCSNREIAQLLSLSRYTIEDYVKGIYRKLAVGSRTAAVHEARTLGLLA